MAKTIPPPTAPLVPLAEVAHRIGYGVEGLPEAARWAGVDLAAVVVEDWAGNRCMSAENAAELVGGARSYMDRHYAKWDAYRSYLEDRKRAAQAEREREAAEAREAAREQARLRAEKWTAELEARTEREIAERAAARAERDGQPMAPEAFFRKNSGT